MRQSGIQLRRHETQILRVRQGYPLPEGWRVTRILQTCFVPNSDGGTGQHLEYDVEVERWRDASSARSGRTPHDAEWLEYDDATRKPWPPGTLAPAERALLDAAVSRTRLGRRFELRAGRFYLMVQVRWRRA